MDDQAKDPAEVSAAAEEAEIEGTEASEALALPVFGGLGRFAIKTSSEPAGSASPNHHRFKFSTASSIFIVFLAALIGLAAYVSLGYLKIYQGDKVAAKTIADIRPDKFNNVSVQTFQASKPFSLLNDKVYQITHQVVSITIGQQTVNPSATDISSWLTVNENLTNNTAAVLVNKPAVTAYFNNLASSNTHQVVNADKLVHSDGSFVVVSAGQQGETVSGAQNAITDTENKLLSGGGLKLDLPASYTAFQTVIDSPFDKLIEVNLTSKQMYVYQKDTLVKQFPVSAGAPETPTPTGTFHIYEKLISQNMSGYNVDGTTYFQPNVPYVNYFTGSDAIHGNYWRPTSYFGNINSSHGCVGLEVSDAEWVYNWAPIGTTVIVHN